MCNDMLAQALIEYEKILAIDVQQMYWDGVLCEVQVPRPRARRSNTRQKIPTMKDNSIPTLDSPKTRSPSVPNGQTGNLGIQ